MSKFILRKRGLGFTTVSNSVIKELKKDLPSLGLYTYLLHLPDNWEFYKTFICKDCAIGIKRLDSTLKKLCALGLVQYGQKRDAQGRFSEFYMDIYDIETLSINNLPKNDVQITPERQNCRTAEAVGRSGEAIKEEVIKEEVINNNTKNYSATDVAQERNEMTFDEFWKIYPIKKNKVRSKKIWDREKFASIVTLICCDVLVRVKHEPQWQQPQFIPHPATYLGNKLWTDDVTKASEPESSKGDKSSSFYAYMKSKPNGETYDQNGNTSDPFR
jgi:hypothetical protein